MSDLTKRLRIFSGLRAMGDPTAFGEDATLFGVAADHIDALQDEVERLRADPRLALTKDDLERIIDHVLTSFHTPVKGPWEGRDKDEAALNRLRAAAAALEGSE